MSARPLAFVETAVPRRIGKYAVSGLIGQGAMGVVYRALDPDIHRPVAIKTIRQALHGDGGGPAAAERFRHEARAAGRLNHPNIVSIYEYGQDDVGGELFIAMECIEGPSLAALAERGARLSLPDVMAVMLQLLDALQCAHEQRIWHCDIKPSNLLVTQEGRLKVTDFGIARIESADLTVRNAVWGSPGYMAPERYAGGALDQRVDVFSCGVLLYELLTGGAPFNGSASAVMYQVLQQEPPPPSTVPQSASTTAFDAVVARALAKHPGDRFTTAHEMRQALLAAAPSGSVRHLLSATASADMRGAAEQPTLVLPRPAAAVATTGATTPFDPRLMAQIEALLRPFVGPVSRFVVRDAARRSGGTVAQVVQITAQSLTADERVTFLRRVGRIVGVDHHPAAAPAPRTTGSVPVLGQTPMRPDIVDKAARLLALQLGPIATLLAKRAAAVATCREQFFCTLADSAAEQVDRKALLEQLWRIE